MAAPNNAHQRVNITQEAEDVRDVIYIVDPDETPGISNFNTANADNTTHQWHEDKYDPPGANAHIDGDEFAADAVVPPTRLNNECQILRKDLTVTMRARILNKYGPDDELNRQVTLKATALKRDLETALFANNAKVVDNGTIAPEMAGLPTWIAGTVDGRADRGGTGTDPDGEGGTEAGDGTPRALTEDGLLGIVAAIYKVSSIRPNCLMLGVDTKQQFSKFQFTANARIATQYQDQGSSPRGGVQVVGAVDTWVTDYGVLDVVPDRYQRDRDAFILNTAWCDVADFRPMSVYLIGRRSDTDERMILVDATLVPRNRDTLGVFADVDPAADMTAS